MCDHIETSQLICRANELTGFYMMATLAFNELMLINPVNNQWSPHRETNQLICSENQLNCFFYEGNIYL